MSKAKTQAGYCLQSAANGITKHKAMSLASIITTAACLLLISAVFMLGLNIEANMAEFQVDNTMLAFVDDSYTDAQARALQSQIENVDHVVKVSYITREEAMADYIDQYEDGDATNSRLQASIFRNRYAIEMDNQEAVHEVAEAVSNIKGIADTRIDEVVSQGFAVVQKVVTIVGIMLTVLMLTICVVIMTNTIKLTTMARKEEIAVMKMMGAYDNFVKMPLLFEGCIVGCAGALLAFALSTIIYVIMEGMMQSSGVLSLITFQPFSHLAGPLIAIDLIMGLGVGCAGCAISIRKHLDV